MAELFHSDVTRRKFLGKAGALTAAVGAATAVGINPAGATGGGGGGSGLGPCRSGAPVPIPADTDPVLAGLGLHFEVPELDPPRNPSSIEHFTGKCAVGDVIGTGVRTDTVTGETEVLEYRQDARFM